MIEANWTVYILRCADKTFYTGITTDSERRVKEHNESIKGAKYTQCRRPVELVYEEVVGSRSEAGRREYAIKQLSRSEKMALIEKAGRLECHLTVEEEGGSAPELLMAGSGFSKQKIKTIMQKGAVWLSRAESTQRLRRAKKELQKGDKLHLYYDGKVLSQPALGAKLVLDCTAYSIWLKPSGMLSQGSKWGDHTTIVRWVESEFSRVTYQVHRLDRATSGLIAVAHSKKMARILTGMFERRAIKKSYQAVVVGHFPDGQVTLESEIEGRAAISRVKRLNYDSGRNASLVEVEIETGRKHQIRRHLSESGFPIIGDRLYGEYDKAGQQLDLQLMAVKLVFDCPVENVARVVEVPESLGQRALTNGFNWR